MPAIQILKKKLRGIRSTQKLTKAMKTVSAVKFSRLNSVYSAYKSYADNCGELYEEFKADAQALLPPADGKAPECFVVMASNKGMCGNFNSQIFAFADEYFENCGSEFVLIPCGKTAITHFTDKKIPFLDSFVFSDTPSYNESEKLFGTLFNLRASRKVSRVRIIYPKYSNMMKQTPVCEDFFAAFQKGEAIKSEALLIPDRQTVIKSIGGKIFKSILYNIILETALGAQAATLMTMRSAFDTATEVGEALEREINRKRQSAVTADVLETASER